MQDLRSLATDLLEMRGRLARKAVEEMQRDLSNVAQADSFEETVFKIYE